MDGEKSNSPPSDGLGDSIPKLRAFNGRTTGPTRRSTKGRWTPEEDEILRKAVARFEGKNWKKIAECFKDRSDVQCLHRWQKVLNPDLIKGPWSKEEDEIIVELVNKYGPKKWSTIAQHLPGRIGKQCRERWHNHLNPSINKEAWTQEEELALIRAHQIYGNRWAELTKFLPGRADNSIKNHWNSSVKKKLESYLKSGLLSQFPEVSDVRNSNQKKMTTPTTMQNNGDDSSLKGTKVEEVSECSQNSRSDDACDPGRETENAALHRRQDCCPYENSSSRDEHNNSCTPACEDLYHPSPDAVIISFPDIPEHEGCSSPYMVQTFLNDPGDSSNSDTQFATDVIPNIPFGLGQDPPNSQTDLVVVSDRNDVCLTYQASVGLLDASCSIGYSGVDSDKMHMLIPDEECCRVLFSDSMHEGSFQSEKYTTVDFGMEENEDVARDVLKLVPVNNFGFGSGKQQICPQLDKKPNEHAEQENAGSLCYEPPRFPSLDIPFLSCDLIQSSSEMRQEFSPLGIRQLMMTSLSPLTPFRLWDSPSRDDSSDAVLRSAARTFTGTPSILKKRNRDLLSPLSDRRIDKKLETDMASTLSRDFSLLDVMFDESANQGSAICFSSLMQQSNFGVSADDYRNCEIEARDEGNKSENAISVENLPGNNGTGAQDTLAGSEFCVEDAKMVRVKVDAGEHVKQHPGVLVEHDMNDLLLYSPNQIDLKAEKSLEPSSNHAKLMKSSAGNLLKNTTSHLFSGKEQGSESAAGVCMQNATSSSAQQENFCETDNAGTDSGCESLNIFTGTPFKRSVESPSAWKSPWFINTLLPNPSMEDICFFLSPGDRSYDAVGLMKQISEHTAAAYANAQEVLINETPKTKQNDKSSKDESPNEENHIPADQLGNHSQLASNALMERRTLDFSECGTPGKILESGKSAALSFSNPSSYLLKNCR